jgi:Holliday junction resolvase RusA-like endonuclease
MNQLTVTMPYIPNLTANHCHRMGAKGRMYLEPVVRTWRRALACEIERECINKGHRMYPPLTIRIDWEGPQEPDQDGRCKSVWDAVQQATGINDKHYVAEPGGFTKRSAREAEIPITIRWGDDGLVARALEQSECGR